MNKKLLFFLSSSLSALGIYAQRSPNVLLIVVDDLGYADLAAYGNPSIQTPNIDKLGDRGVRFTHAYASSPISGPSRAAILTGRCQNRFGYEFMPYDKFDDHFMKDFKKYYLPFNKKPEGLKAFSPNMLVRRSKHNTDLPQSEITIAELLKDAGYETGLIGKWNISDSKITPDKYGYDYSYYFSGALTRYVDDPVDTSKYVSAKVPCAFSDVAAWQKRAGPTAIREGSIVVKDTGYLTFSFAEKAIDFIEKHKENKFLLTLTFNAPHDPFQAPKSYYDKINEPDHLKRVYYAMIEALDDAVGNVCNALKENGLYDNTLIIFTSDNGGAAYTGATDNNPLLGGKCTLFDGGLRVPFYIRFPQNMMNESVVYNNPISNLDIFTTIASATNISLPEDRIYDGENLLPYLNGQFSDFPHQNLFWRNGYVKACIIDNWKLYIAKKDKQIFLFDLATDPQEKNNLATAHPDKVKEMQKMINEWEKTQTIDPLWPSSGNVSIMVNGRYYHFPV